MVSPVARGLSCRTEGCWTEIKEGFFSFLDPFSILLTQPLTAVGVSVNARLVPWEEVWSVEDIALPGSVWHCLHGITAPRAACSSGDSFLCLFSLQFLVSVPHSLFGKQCFISSSVSPCTEWTLLARAAAHLGKRRGLSGGLQWRVCLQ